VLGWSDAETEEEVGNYLKRVAAERASQLQPDDESADRVRLEAPDITFGFEEDDMIVPGADQGGAPKPGEDVAEPAGTPADQPTNADEPGGRQ
jgi:glycerol-3-phosphate dehydrogenase